MNQDSITVLLTCLSYENEAVKKERLAHVPAEDWRAVTELARQHGVAPLVYHRLKQLGIALPGELSEELKQEYWKNTRRNMRMYQELGKLLRRLHEKDIPVIALKGAHLAEKVYDTIGLRINGDVDLLVKKDDLPRIDNELLALGYKPEECNRVITQGNHSFSYILSKNGLNVEIHWVLVASDLPLQIDMEGVWSRAQPVILAQASAWTLSPEDLLIYLCLHTAIHHTCEIHLIMLCDIGEMLRRYGARVDWQEIAMRARQWGILRAVYSILWLAQELLEAAVPVDQLASLRPEGFEEHYLNLMRENILANHADANMGLNGSVGQLWGPRRLGNKLALIRERLLPSREIMSLKYPAPANSWRIYLYYPVRILYLLRRYGATLWQLVRGDPETRAAAEQTNEVTRLRDWLLSN